MFQRTGAPLLLLYIPARGLCSSPIQSKKEKEEEKQAQPATAPTTPAVDAVDAHARETVWTTPNLITMSRIAASPLLSWAILEGHYDWAVAGVAVAAATDWLDGYIAKTYNQTVCMYACCVCVLLDGVCRRGVVWSLPRSLIEGVAD